MIQIFGKKKCFDTKKAERFFKERRVKVQFIDLLDKGISPGEYKSVKTAIGSLDDMLDEKHPDVKLISYLAYEKDKDENIIDDPSLLKTPIVRNGRLATVGYCPDVWTKWLEAEK